MQSLQFNPGKIKILVAYMYIIIMDHRSRMVVPHTKDEQVALVKLHCMGEDNIITVQ